ncbi:hypothetical protein G7048_19225 [Diaphorobacter sp. HDW4B]|uniref:hypothetical protein n=1 Tax=Diaphorobacter sp. HDW4B TaxID=2714925 RepID=UPI00140D1788|nr:hypothetical protein [Diaphorobacter sp. HDW4B]QIL72298.1 hypothetical protein G7048_19225 [Diaphorobacter sp. HDW4B]
MSLKQEQDELWEHLRSENAMVADAPSRKIGMPHATPFSVSFPIEEDGVFTMVEIDIDQVPRFVQGLIDELPRAVALGAKATADLATYDAICKAMGQ